MSATAELDPVTFEVLKNSFITAVDQMAEQILRTCYSFVIYNRDFSNALHDANGDSVAQGNGDISVHVGTLHYTCKAVIAFFKGDMHPGDVYMINDPYAGGTHFSDVRLIRPIFVGDEVIGYAQSNGHWSDMGGSVPGSFDVMAKDMFREGLRITPVRIFDRDRFCRDVAHMIASNTRAPASLIGDMHAQAEATNVAAREVLRLVNKYGKETVVAGMAAVQDYVERTVRQRLAALPDGSWETVDYIDRDVSGGEGMIPIRVKATIVGDKVIYDFTGSHPTIGSIYNSAFGATFSGCVAGMKTFFPDLPLNSGLYRVIEVVAPPDTVVSAAAVTNDAAPVTRPIIPRVSPGLAYNSTCRRFASPRATSTVPPDSRNTACGISPSQISVSPFSSVTRANCSANKPRSAGVRAPNMSDSASRSAMFGAAGDGSGATPPTPKPIPACRRCRWICASISVRAGARSSLDLTENRTP